MKPRYRIGQVHFVEDTLIALLRIICNCGARLRVADTSRGKSVRCSYCNADIFVPKVYRTRQVTEENPQGVVWIRATCACAKVIKAPEEWLGKVGKCPKCRRDLALLDMLAEQSPPGEDEKIAKEIDTPSDDEVRRSPSKTGTGQASGIRPSPKTTVGGRSSAGGLAAVKETQKDATRESRTPGDSSTGSVSGLLDLAAGEEPIIGPDDGADLFEGRRPPPPPGASIDAPPSPEFTKPEGPKRSLRQRLFLDHPVAPYGVAALLAILSGWNVFRFEASVNARDSARWSAPAAPVYFLDLGTGRPFVMDGDVVPPVDAPSGFAPNEDTKGGVRVYLFACGQCKSPEQATIGFVESFTKTGKTAAESMNYIIDSGQPPELARDSETKMMSGRLIGQVDGQNATWDPANSTMAAVRVSRLNRKCEDGRQPVLCMPPKP